MEKNPFISTFDNFGESVRFSQPTDQKQKQFELDLLRTPFGFLPAEETATFKAFLIFILRKFFTESNIIYYQGMHEAGSVLADRYFSDIFNNFKVANNLNITNTSEKSPQSIKIENEIFSNILEQNISVYNDFSQTLDRLLSDKVLKLVHPDFEEYKRINYRYSTTMGMKKFISINEKDLFCFLDLPLTFFSRLSGNRDVAYKLLALIQNSDHYIFFSILYYFYDNAYAYKQSIFSSEDTQKSFLINKIDEKDIKGIMELHNAFMLANPDLKSDNNELLSAKGILAIAAGSALLLSIFRLHGKILNLFS